VFTTAVDGGGADEEVAARLGLMVDRVFGSVRVRSVDERAVRRRLQVVPNHPAP
jgi:DNA-binding GntR family transcriptional regulator